MKKEIKNPFILLGFFACSLSLLAGCAPSEEESKEQNNDEIITKILNESDPMATVHLGEFESISTEELVTVDENIQTYTSSTIFDMPKDGSINVVYNNEENRSLQSVSSLLNNIVEANNDVRIVSVKDREGKYKNNMLSSDGSKLSVSSYNGFEYGEVYQIELNDAPYLAFEGKNPEIRKLTIEIEDDPSEQATYDEKVLKENIVTLDRNKVYNQKQDITNNTYSFDYDGVFPNMKEDDVFYVTSNDVHDERLDFYGLFVSNTNSHIIYRAPEMEDIYSSFHMKGVEEIDLNGAEVLLNSDLVLQQFKSSAVARGLVQTLLTITDDDINRIIDIMKHINIDVSVNHIGNRLESKIILKLSSYKIKSGSTTYYLGLEIGYQTITEYTMDFDIRLSYKWIFPTGVDYKLKCIEDTQDSYYIRFNVDVRPIEEIKSDPDYVKQLTSEIDKVMDNDFEDSIMTLVTDKDDMKPSSSATRTTFPLIKVDINALAPLQIRMKIDFYFDLGFKAMALVKYETHTTKVDFSFSNMDGDGADTAIETKQTSNFTAYFGGNFHIEAGVRCSLGISFTGLYDYLHAEVYAEAYVNLTVSGFLSMNLEFSSVTEFSGLISVDLALTAGIRAGLDLKALFLHGDYAYNWSVYLFRLKYDNPFEHWCEDSDSKIEMSNESMSIDDTNILNIQYFDSLTFGIKEKLYKANDTFSIMSGILVPNSLENLASGHIFSFIPNDPSLIEINEDGLIHVKDGTASEFVTTFTVHVSNWVGFIEDKEVTLHFKANESMLRDVYVDNEILGHYRIGQYRPGYTFTLPEVENIHGYAFDYYDYNGQHYEVGDNFTMPNDTVSFTLHYHELPIYRVYFYDAYNILVAYDDVYQGDDAYEPSAIIRDRYVDEGWEFISWDKSLSNIQHETHIYGIYIHIA